MSGFIGLSQKRNGLVNQFTSLGIDDNATSNAVTIDASENVTITDGAHDFDVASHDTSNGLKLGGTLVTATAAELNYLDTTSGIPGVGTFLRGDKTWQAAGSTSASDLDSGTLAVARMAAGTIVKSHANTYTTATTITSTTHGTGTATGLTIVFQPISDSNKLFIQVGLAFYANASDPGFGIEIDDGTGVIATDANNTAMYNNPSGHHSYIKGKYPFGAFFDPRDDTSRTYVIRAYQYGGSNLIAQNDSNPSYVSIFEIKQ